MAAAMASTRIAFPPRAVEFQSRSSCWMQCDGSVRRKRLHFRLVTRANTTQVDNNEGLEKNDGEDEGPNPMPAVDRRREVEKFVVRDMGKYRCRSCGYVYDQSLGDPSYPVPPGVQFRQLPDDWRCSTCGAAKSYFNSISVEIAGFAENQNFGIGTNALTSGQKSLLIYGSLLLFFLLFLSGYFIQ